MQATWSQLVAEVVVFSNDFAGRRDRPRRTLQHEGALGRNEHPTTRKVGWWLEGKNQPHREVLRAKGSW